MQRALSEQAAGVKADLLAEFFAKSGTHSALFDAARELEAAAFALRVAPPSAMSTFAQSVLGVLADFFNIDRKRVIV